MKPFVVVKDSGEPLLVQSVPLIDPDQRVDFVLNGPAVILLFTELSSSVSKSPHRALQALGLSRAEASVASLVGAGLRPEEAAAQLGKGVGTVRGQLKSLYAKLGISRQSQLAVLVARLLPEDST